MSWWDAVVQTVVNTPVLWAVVKVVLILAFVLLNVLVLIWWERKQAAFIQLRLGPMRTGRPHGWLQTIADVIKLLAKEDVVPRTIDRWLYILAPLVAFTPALLVWVVIPFGPTWVARDLNIALVFIAAVTSFGILAMFMAGWGSNNKYALVSAMRAAAVLMSYEVPMVLAVIGVVMISGSLSLNQIVKAQMESTWFLFLQPLGFIVFLMCAFAELNRTPFDLAEAESELIAGYHIEYSGMRFAFFLLAEYANLISLSAIAATLFLGGWSGPWLPPWLWFVVKTWVVIFVVLWIRWTLPRIRIDHLMEFGWKFLLPASLINIAVTGLIMVI